MTTKPRYRGFSCFPLLMDGYPVNRFISCYPKEMYNAGVAVLANRFGTNWAQLGKWIKYVTNNTLRKHGVEVHFISGPARRDGRMEQFDLWRDLTTRELNEALEAGTLKGLTKQIRRIKTNLERTINDKTEVFICPGLEDGYTDKAFTVLLNAFKDEFSSWTTKPKWVRCPSFGGNLIPNGCLKEVHGYSKTKAGIYNPDGVSVAFHDGEDYFETMSMPQLQYLWNAHWEARMTLIWPANFQGAGSSSSHSYPSIFCRKYIVTQNAIQYGNIILKEW